MYTVSYITVDLHNFQQPTYHVLVTRLYVNISWHFFFNPSWRIYTDNILFLCLHFIYYRFNTHLLNQTTLCHNMNVTLSGMKNSFIILLTLTWNKHTNICHNNMHIVFNHLHWRKALICYVQWHLFWWTQSG